MSRFSQAWAYVTIEPSMTAQQAERDLSSLDSLYDLRRSRRLYRAAMGHYEETNPDDYGEQKAPPSERMRDLGAADHRRVVAILTDTDRDY